MWGSVLRCGGRCRGVGEVTGCGKVLWEVWGCEKVLGEVWKRVLKCG